MKLQGICPQCEQQVEFTAQASGGGRVFKCSNCWHVLDEPELKRAQRISGALAQLEVERRKILEGD
jgi:transcription initiation factor IIE alpha subunit